MHKNLKISIVIPCFNAGKAIAKTIDSIYENSAGVSFEIIIVDDASTDAETHKAYIDLSDKAKVIKLKENVGPGIARNVGIKESSGDWIVLIDSDDLFINNAIYVLFDEIKNNNQADFFFWNYDILYVENNERKKVCTSSILKENSNELDPYKFAKNFIIHGCSPFKKQVWTLIGGYDSELSKGGVEDIDFWRRAVLNGARGFHINKYLYQWNKSNSGVNSNICEYKYLLHRKKILPFYDKYNPEYAQKMRDYIYNYYSQRLQQKELREFVKQQKHYFKLKQKLKVVLMNFKFLYKSVRVIKNNFSQKK